MASFKVPCPSCEHQVLITNPKLVGTKVECPKCKYRFKVEEPAGGVPKDEAKADKKADKGKKKADAAGDPKKKKNSKKLVAMVVGVLAVVVLAVVGVAMMGGDKKPAGPKGVVGGGNTGPGGTGDGTDEPKDKDKDKKDADNEPPKKVNPNPRSDKDERAATNLLPPQTVALYRFDVDKVQQTPLGMLFDPVTRGMFRASFGVEADEVATYHHAFVGEARDPFGVIRLKEPVNAADTARKMDLAGKPATIKGRTLHAFKSNPFATGAANAGSFASLFADALEATPAAPAKPAAPRVLGVCVYDTQHILVGDHKLLEQFLRDLDDKGLPKLVASAQFAENPMYLSVDQKLKRVLKELGAEGNSPPPVVCVERPARGAFTPALFKAELQPVVAVVGPVLDRTEYVAAALNSFTPRGVTATVRLVMASESAAAEVAREHLTPGLTAAAYAMTLFFNAPVEFRNYANGGVSPPGPGGILPGGPMFPGGPMSPGGRPPITPSVPGGGGSRPGAAPPPPPPPVPDNHYAQAQPNLPGRGGQSGYPMGGYPMGYPSGGMMQPPGPGGTTFPQPEPTQPQGSHIDLTVTDNDVIIGIELLWSDDAYRRLIAPRMIGVVNTVKGKMAVYASDTSFAALSQAVTKMTAATKQFPRGTADRRLTDAARMGLRHRPETRVSFFAELLPYLNRGGLAVGVDRDLGWFEGANLPVAEAWVPELLVASYPQAAWRATSPHTAVGHVLGGTNYVAIAGVGMDAARHDPKAEAKKVGITGYEWGSKVEEVADGLDRTIYLMQTPPGLPQPWLSGGGATVRGLDETDPMRGFRHTHGTPGGKPGTFALMGDGSVRFLPGDIKPDLLLAMATRAGGEDIADRLDKEAPLVTTPAGKGKDAELKSDATPAKSDKPAEAKGTDPKETGTKPEDAPAPKEKKN